MGHLRERRLLARIADIPVRFLSANVLSIAADFHYGESSGKLLSSVRGRTEQTDNNVLAKVSKRSVLYDFGN